MRKRKIAPKNTVGEREGKGQIITGRKGTGKIRQKACPAQKTNTKREKEKR